MEIMVSEVYEALIDAGASEGKAKAAAEAIPHLERAIARVKHADRHLLVVNVSERCIATRLAMYLREYFGDYDVDVEYNRDGDIIKKLQSVVQRYPRSRDEETQCQRVLPDVIVHRRGDHNSNLLVIEMKKASNKSGIESDLQRLRAFRNELSYNLGALVVCRTGSCPEVCVELDYE